MALTRAQQRAEDANQNREQPESAVARENQSHQEPQHMNNPRQDNQNTPPGPNSTPTSTESSVSDEENQIFEWQGVTLPEFEIPQWRKRAGVPTIVLRPIELGARVAPTNDSDIGSEDVGVDSQSDDSISDEEPEADEGDLPPGNNNPIVHDNSRQDPPDNPPDNPQENPPDNPPENPPDNPQDNPPDNPPDNPRDNPQDNPPDNPQETPPDNPPDNPRDNPQDKSQDNHRNSPPPQDSPEGNESVISPTLSPERYSDDSDVNGLEVERYGENVSKFIHSPFGPERFLGGGWYGVKLLGRGSFGMVGVWERRDVNNHTVDSVAIKHIGRDKRDEHWDDSHPTEVELMRALVASSNDQNNVVQIRGYRKYRHHEVHRIYMEYCPYKDLQRLIEEYRYRSKWLPEAFIWHVFLHLARGCQSLTRLRSPKADPRKYKDPSRNEIVHLDIKPLNMFLSRLGPEITEGGTRYPEVKIGDFGVGEFTGIADKDNPTQYRGRGTTGYKALEMETFDEMRKPEVLKQHPHIERANQRHKRFREEDPNYRRRRPQLLAHTNVWGIGAVMCDLMTLKPVKRYLYNPENIEYDNEDEEEATVQKKLEDTPYHQTLIKYALQCIHPNPARRPTPSELIAALEALGAKRRQKWNGPEQAIPWGNFHTLKKRKRTEDDEDDDEEEEEEGEIPWEASTGMAYPPPDSSIAKSTAARRRWSDDEPMRHNKRVRRKRKKQARRDEERRKRKDQGEENVSSGEVSPVPNTGARKWARALRRVGEWTGWWKARGYEAEPRGYLR